MKEPQPQSIRVENADSERGAGVRISTDSRGPIALWQTAMNTKYNVMLIKFSRDGTN